MKPQNLHVQTAAPDASPEPEPQAWMSALADGEADPGLFDRACKMWRDDAQARSTWHAYHLIGDVMRSDDLASTPQRDAAFLSGVRARLAAEPAILAPMPAPAASTRRAQPWLLPGAMVAGFAVVAGVLVLTRGAAPGGMALVRELAAASSPVRSAAGVPVMTVSGATGQALVLRPFANDPGVLRDARLDEFLRAHQAVGPGMTMAVPGGALRRVDVVTPADTGR